MELVILLFQTIVLVILRKKISLKRDFIDYINFATKFNTYKKDNNLELYCNIILRIGSKLSIKLFIIMIPFLICFYIFKSFGYSIYNCMTLSSIPFLVFFFSKNDP